MTATATLVFALATLALAYLRVVPLLVASMMAGGVAWIAMISSLTAAAQTAAPAWVRAGTGHLPAWFQGLLAAGSFAWGALAERFGNTTALSVAGLALVGGLAALWRWPLHAIQRIDLSPSMHWPDPTLAIIPDPEDGPV